jgi:hypothetical protein
MAFAGGSMAERIFRIFSLAFLSIGFVVGVAGADKNGAKDLFVATGDLIDHVAAAREANALNEERNVHLQKVGLTLITEPAPEAHKAQKTAGEVLPTTTN